MRVNIYIIICVIIPIFICCKKDVGIDTPPVLDDISEIEARLSLTIQNEGIISKSTPLIDSVISNVNILVFDINGNLLKHLYFENISSMTINCSSGNKTIVAIANTGNAGFSSYTTIESLRNALFANITNNFTQCILAGEITLNLKNGDDIQIEMIRLISKITVVFNKDQLDEETSVTIRNISLKNVPTTCRLLSENTPETVGEISEYGDFIDTGLEPCSHENATPLYMFENMQGTIGSATVESLKSPGGAAPLCSYIEIKADYLNKAKQGVVKYRFYLGNNITNNFDVQRNIWYRLNVFFKEDAINEVSWRIDTSEITDVLYLVETLSQPVDGGTVGGGGYYKYGTLPELTATPNTNYTFTGWSPVLAPVIGNTTYTATFQYIDPTIHVTSVTLSKDTMNLDLSVSENLTANVLPSNANNKNVVWSSSDPNIANVDQTGKVTGVNAGTASITVITSDGGYRASCIVKVFRIIKLYFHIARTAKVDYKDDDGGYWYLCEPIRDDIYVKSNSGEGIPGTISYTINWAYDPLSGFSPPESTTATKAIIISNTLNKLLESGSAWGGETDFTICYPSIVITGIVPPIMTNPPTKILVDQEMNTYNYTEIGK